MTCFRPIKGYIIPGEGFKPTLRGHKAGYGFRSQVPCNHCHGCRQKKRSDWAIRCHHEAKEYAENSFITLTYDEDNLPQYGSLVPEDLNEFFQELRNTRRKDKIRFRYFAAGEYGSQTKRPHYHVLLFNHWFSDAKQGVQSDNWTSEQLNEIWGKGHCTIGRVEYASAMYTAKYCMERPSKTQAEKIGYYERYDPFSQTIVEVEPEFNRASRMPGLGNAWIKKNWRDVFPSDEVIVATNNGYSRKEPPDYYLRWLQENHPDVWLEVKRNRKDGELNEQTETRLAVRELAQRNAAKNLSKKGNLQ